MAFLSSRNGITILTVITAAVHLLLGVTQANILFILNGIGYLALLYATFWTPGFLQGQKSLIRWLYIGFAAVTIIGYFASWGMEGFSQPVGLFTKIVEVLLIVGLWQSKDS